jgi:carbamoyl-phosphate synthase large subunit
LRPKPDYVVVKVPVFSFAKMRGVETILGPEMKSTGEVLGIDATYAGALRKGFVGAGIRLPSEGARVLVSVSDEEKPDGVDLMRRLVALGHRLVATPGTFELLEANGIAAERVNKIGEGAPDVLDVIKQRSVDLVINDFKSSKSQTDNYRIRRAAVEASIASLTSLDTARALVTALESEAGPPRSLQEYQASHLGALAP